MARIAELCLRTAQKLTTPNSQLSAKTVVSLHGGGANIPGEEAKSLMAPTRGRLPWGKAIDILMGWTRRVPEDFDGIVCVGEDEAEKYRGRHDHVMYLPNGVDCRLFEGMARESLAPLMPKTSLSLLCVARIDRQKNQMMLVEWLARNPQATVRLVGPVTQPDYRAEIEARAEQLGVWGSTRTRTCLCCRAGTSLSASWFSRLGPRGCQSWRATSADSADYARRIPRLRSGSLRAISMRLTTPCGGSEAMKRCAGGCPRLDAQRRPNTTGENLPNEWLIFTPKYD